MVGKNGFEFWFFCFFYGKTKHAKQRRKQKQKNLDPSASSMCHNPIGTMPLHPPPAMHGVHGGYTCTSKHESDGVSPLSDARREILT